MSRQTCNARLLMTMRKGIACAVLITTTLSVLYGQYSISSSAVYGGELNDIGRSVDIEEDTLVIAGYSNSGDLFEGGILGAEDYWVARITTSGDTVYNRNYGGSGPDELSVARYHNFNENIFTFGSTRSVDGDVGSNPGFQSAWLFVTDRKGEPVASRVYSGGAMEIGADAVSLSSGGYAVLVKAGSAELEGQVNNGGFDFWVAEVNQFGAVIWSQMLGGSETEEPASILRIPQGYLVAGSTNSTDGAVVGNSGGFDFWVVRLDIDGNFVWAKTYGGSMDDKAHDLVAMPNGTFLVVGESQSSDGDVSANKGATDGWAININGNGDLLWEKSFGGSEVDRFRAAAELADSTQFVIVGSTESVDGDLTGNKGRRDALVVYIDDAGRIIRQMNYGGTEVDELADVVATTSPPFVWACGTSDSDRQNLPTFTPDEENLWLLGLINDTIPCETNGECQINPVFPGVINAVTDATLCTQSCNVGMATGPAFATECFDFEDIRTTWYKVRVDSAAKQMTVSARSDELNNLQIAIVQSLDCNEFLLLDCASGTNGVVSLENLQITADTAYYVVIGDTSGRTGIFELCVEVDALDFCNFNPRIYATSTSMGSPLEGPYLPGEQVNICYEVSGWKKKDCNGLQGIVPTFGEGWAPENFNSVGLPVNVTTGLQPIANGSWSQYAIARVNYNFTNPDKGFSIGQGMPAGYYFVNFDTTPNDGGPNQSTGDQATCDDDDSSWQLCFTLTTRSFCEEDLDCSISVQSFADGEIGANVNQACADDPPVVLDAQLKCCLFPAVDPVNDFTICSGDTAVIALESNLDPDAQYSWTFEGGPNILGATPGTDRLFQQTLVNTSSFEESVRYSVIATKDGCTTPPMVFDISVLPILRGVMSVDTSGPFCEGEGFFLQFQFFNGEGPFQGQFAIDGVPQPRFLVEGNAANLPVELEDDAVIEFLEFENVSCNGVVEGIFEIEIENLGRKQLDTAVCENDLLVVGPDTIVFPGNYTVVIPAGSANGCDSIVEVSLSHLPVRNTVVDTTICFGDTVVVGEQKYFESGNYFDTLLTINACDSVVNLKLFVTTEIIDERNALICSGDGYMFGDTILTESGIYMDTVPISATCDSVKTLSLSVLDPIVLTETNILPDTGNSSGAIIISIEGGLPPYEYLWSNGDTTQSLMNVETGDYSVTITDFFGCEAVYNFFISTSVTTPIRGISQLSVFPNPVRTHDWITLSLYNERSDLDLLEVRFVDVNGRALHRGQWALSGQQNTYRLPMDKAVSGAYFIVLAEPDGRSSSVRPVIVTR